ncbi:MAG: tRNA dimethylallyltransferase [Phycisphaerales bacterium]
MDRANFRGPDKTYRHDPIMLGMHWPVEAINSRINLRVKAMFYPDKVDPVLAAAACPNGESLPDETRRLHGAGLLGEQAREALGYKQVLEHLTGGHTLDEAFERTKVLTRRFAKQQRTPATAIPAGQLAARRGDDARGDGPAGTGFLPLNPCRSARP